MAPPQTLRRRAHAGHDGIAWRTHGNPCQGFSGPGTINPCDKQTQTPIPRPARHVVRPHSPRIHRRGTSQPAGVPAANGAAAPARRGVARRAMNPPVITGPEDRDSWGRILSGRGPGPEDLDGPAPWHGSRLGTEAEVRTLAPDDSCGSFHCGSTSYDRWLVTQQRTRTGIGHSSLTKVLATPKGRVLAYYSWSAGAVLDPDGGQDADIPVGLLSHLAVDRRYARTGIGRAMLKDALSSTRDLSRVIGCTGLLIDGGGDAGSEFVSRSLPWAVTAPGGDSLHFVRIRT